MRGITVEVTRTEPQLEHTESTGPETYRPDPDYTGWTDEEVTALAEKASRERRRREILAQSLIAADDAARAWHTASGHMPGDPWVAPSGATQAYPRGWIVDLDGVLWRSTTPANVQEPGGEGWEEVTP